MNKEIIFCVDDEKIVLNSLKTELKSEFGNNCIIETAESGDEAIEAIKELLSLGYKLPVVIVDYVMPNMKGDELLEKIHSISPKTLKVLLTGQATVEGVTNSINKADLYRYIAKPWNNDDLILTISQALKSYHQENQLVVQNQQLKELSTSLEKKVKIRTIELEKYQNHLEELVELRTKELSISKEKAEESDRLKTAFLANISHEIRTPMNGIMGFANLLSDPNTSIENQTKFIDIIKKSGERMLDTLNGLMEMSKLETGQVKIHLNNINLNEELKNLHTFFKLEASCKNLLFNLLLPKNSDLLVIETDRDKLNGILSNLIKNAIKYSETGSVDFGYEIYNDCIEFFVRDTGIGIPKERQKAIFDRFVQADLKDVKVLEGSGLGLSISKSYIEMLNGEITLESNEGQGSKFRFTIPLTINNKKQVNKETNIKNIDYSKFKILIVEDEEVAMDYLTIILKDQFEKILCAKNGIEAVEVFSKNKDIDLILMDVKMPEMGGYEATKKIREINTSVGVIAQTAYALHGDREKAINAGCNDYITKPIKKEELLLKINKLLKRNL